MQDLPAIGGVFHEDGEESGGVSVVVFPVQSIASVHFGPFGRERFDGELLELEEAHGFFAGIVFVVPSFRILPAPTN